MCPHTGAGREFQRALGDGGSHRGTSHQKLPLRHCRGRAGTRFTSFTGTKAQILTQKAQDVEQRIALWTCSAKRCSRRGLSLSLLWISYYHGHELYSHIGESKNKCVIERFMSTVYKINFFMHMTDGSRQVQDRNKKKNPT